jgi:hypothetical protein
MVLIRSSSSQLIILTEKKLVICHIKGFWDFSPIYVEQTLAVAEGGVLA